MLYEALLSFPNPDIYDMWIIAKPAPKNTHCSTGTISTIMQTDSSLHEWETGTSAKSSQKIWSTMASDQKRDETTTFVKHVLVYSDVSCSVRLYQVRT